MPLLHDDGGFTCMYMRIHDKTEHAYTPHSHDLTYTSVSYSALLIHTAFTNQATPKMSPKGPKTDDGDDALDKLDKLWNEDGGKRESKGKDDDIIDQIWDEYR
jgi:hypothetical protein